MTNFITAPAANGETFEFRSNAKNTPAFAVIASDNLEQLEVLATAARAEIADLLAREIITEDEAERRYRSDDRLAGGQGTYLRSKHATRAAAVKAAEAARNTPGRPSVEIVEIFEA